SSVVLEPTGAVALGDVWTITLDGVSFVHTAGISETPESVAIALESAIGMTADETYDVQRNVAALTIDRKDEANFDASITGRSGTIAPVIDEGSLSATHWAVVTVTLQQSDPASTIDPGDRWDLFLQETLADEPIRFRYEAGANQETAQPDSIDAFITDNNAPSALILQSGGATKVVEPTSTVILGSGFVVEARPTIHITTNDVPTRIETIITGSETSQILVTASPDASQFTSATLSLSGPVINNSTWTLEFYDNSAPDPDTISFTASWIEGDEPPVTLQDIAQAFFDQLTAYNPVLESVIRFEGDFGASVLSETDEPHDSRFTAQDIDLGKWNQNVNPDIADSTTKPHVTVLGTGDGETDFYKFTITDEMLKNTDSDSFDGLQVIFDIDYGFEEGDAINWGSLLRLYNSAGNLITQSAKETSPQLGAMGSNTFADGYLTHTFFDAIEGIRESDAGVYLIEVANSQSFGGLPEGVDYQLQVSIENHRVDGFIFGPESVLENETGNNTLGEAQDLETPENKNFFTFFDPEIGNAHDPTLEEGDLINYQTPYVKIQGAGDGSSDFFRFNLAPNLFTPTSGNSTGTPDPNENTNANTTYYLEADIQLTGTPKTGDVWVLGLRFRNYEYTITAENPTLQTVVDGFKSLIAADTEQSARYTLTLVGSDILRIKEVAEGGGGFNLTGVDTSGVTQDVESAGFVTRTIKPILNDGTLNPILFSQADLILESPTATVTEGEHWILKVNNTTADYPVQDGDGIEEIATGLFGMLSVTGVTITDNEDGSLSLTDASAGGVGFSLEFTITGAAPTGSAIIDGDPLPGQVSLVDWTDVSFDIASVTPTDGNTWRIVLNNFPYKFEADHNDGPTQIANGLRLAVIADNAAPPYTVSANSGVLRIRRTTPFSASLQVGDARVDDNQDFTSHTYDLTGPVVDGDTWTLQVQTTGGSDIGSSVIYTVGVSDTDLGDVALGLA
ncbi:MAG: hypothetical protein ACYTGQ_14970, partial [Planctomycetota bacterium]